MNFVMQHMVNIAAMKQITLESFGEVWNLFVFHYNDLWSQATPLFIQPFIQADIKAHMKAPYHWPL